MIQHQIRSYREDMRQVRYCTCCGAEEKELTSDCPVILATYQQRNEVAKGLLDFKNGRWQAIAKATA